MRLLTVGDFGIVVAIQPRDFRRMRATWPGSGFKATDRATVTLATNNGDLLGYGWQGHDGRREPRRVNALAWHALTLEANNYVAKELGREELGR